MWLVLSHWPLRVPFVSLFCFSLIMPFWHCCGIGFVDVTTNLQLCFADLAYLSIYLEMSSINCSLFIVHPKATSLPVNGVVSVKVYPLMNAPCLSVFVSDLIHIRCLKNWKYVDWHRFNKFIHFRSLWPIDCQLEYYNAIKNHSIKFCFPIGEIL